MRPGARVSSRFRPFLFTALLGAALLVVTAAAEETVRYDGHKVVRVLIGSQRDLQAMLSLSDDVWSEHIDVGPADFRLRPQAMAALAESGLRYEVLIEDVQSLIDEERTRLASPADGAGWFDDYKDLDAIYAHMDALAALRPDLAQTFRVGTSIEGRTIRGIRITNDAANPDLRRRGMVWGSTQHAREWIAPMVTMYLAEALVTRYDTDPSIKRAVDRVEFLIVPVINVDGYVYTWTTNRLWRKNRRNNGSCFGIDLNRNWGYQWGLVPGSSPDPCSDLYRGTAPFSEPETAALRDFIQARPRVRYVHDMHSYGKLLLAPWGFTSVPPPGHDTYQALGSTMALLIEAVHGQTYVHGPAYTTLYPVSGDLSDWAWGAEQAYSFVFELRGTGFVLPPEEIIPNAEEILPAALHLANFIVRPWAMPAPGVDTAPRPPAYDSSNQLRQR